MPMIFSHTFAYPDTSLPFKPGYTAVVYFPGGDKDNQASLCLWIVPGTAELADD